MTEITSPRGDVLATEEGVRIVFEREYPDPIEDVWSAVTEPDRLERWIGTYTGERTVGATVQFAMTAEGQVDPEPVTIVACDPPRHLVLDWLVPDQPLWRVEVSLLESGTGTALTFVHHLSDSSAAGDLGPGWQYYLDRLGASLEGGEMPEFDHYLGLKGHYTP